MSNSKALDWFGYFDSVFLSIGILLLLSAFKLTLKWFITLLGCHLFRLWVSIHFEAEFAVKWKVILGNLKPDFFLYIPFVIVALKLAMKSTVWNITWDWKIVCAFLETIIWDCLMWFSALFQITPRDYLGLLENVLMLFHSWSWFSKWRCWCCCCCWCWN